MLVCYYICYYIICLSADPARPPVALRGGARLVYLTGPTGDADRYTDTHIRAHVCSHAKPYYAQTVLRLTRVPLLEGCLWQLGWSPTRSFRDANGCATMARNWHSDVGNFASQDFDTFLCSFCVDSPSLQISAILVGHFILGK